MRHLRAFVAVAEELNFTRAARRLFVAQQGLSAQIRQLEDRMGTRLFERSTHRVEMTPSGRLLYDGVVPLLAGIDAVLESTRASSQTRRRLLVGFVVSIEHLMFGPAVTRFIEAHPEYEVVVRFGDTTDPTGGLRTRQSDVAFTYGPFSMVGLESRFISSEPIGVVMSTSHPLAGQADVSIREFVAEPTFDFPTTDQTWRDYWMATRFRKGRPPHIVAQYATLDGLAHAIRAGLGVNLGTRALAESAGPGVVWKEVVGLPPLEHFVTRRIGDDRPQVADFYDEVTASLSSEAPPVSVPTS